MSPEVAPSLPLQAKANPKHDNYVDDACQLGAKTTVAAGCMLGRGTTLGDKCSVKRSVLGHLCKVGSGVRYAEPNSAVFDHKSCAGQVVRLGDFSFNSGGWA